MQELTDDQRKDITALTGQRDEDTLITRIFRRSERSLQTQFVEGSIAAPPST